jgi:prevent-host-death family protein
MSTITVNIAEGKRDFSRLIRKAAEGNEEIVVTKRGRPVAVIVPYGEYLHSRKAEAHRKILESRAAFVKAGVSAAEVHKASRKELKRRS